MTALVNVFKNATLPATLGKYLFDRVVLALFAGIALLAVIDWSQAIDSVKFTIWNLVAISPYFLVAIGFAGYAKASGADALIARAFSGNQFYTITAAALVGAMSPFCSCGVIPLIAAMLAAGVPLAPVMAFWIASPIMDPEMFVLTAAGIGWNFAVAKAIAAAAMGLFAGFATYAFQNMGYLKDPMLQRSAGGCSSKFDVSAPANVTWKFWRDAGRRQVFSDEVSSVGWFLGKWLALAFFLESLMIAYVPSSWISGVVGDTNPLAIPITAIFGMPSYLNGYAAIPLVSGLLEKGMAPGAAMAFMTAGAVSSIPAAIAVYALVRKQVFAFYVVVGLIGAISAGYAFQLSGGAI